MTAPAPIIEVDNVVKRFVVKRTLFGRPQSHLQAVDGVSLSLQAGETLALVGESGCGKSTLGRVAMGLLPADAGQVYLDGTDITGFSESQLRQLRRKAQLIFQDPFASLNPRMTVGEILAEPLMLHRLVPRAMRARRVAELLEQVGLRPHQAARFPHEFSGGQRQRIVIARALAAEPKAIVCDEPVSALDVSIRAQILNLLKGIQKHLHLSFLFISHDLSVVRHIADRIAVMYLGRIVEIGRASDVFNRPRHPYTRALLSAIPAPSPTARRERRLLEGDVPSPITPPAGCHLHPRCPFAEEICKRERPQLDGADHQAACHLWRRLPPAGDVLPREAPLDPALAKLFAAYSPARIETAS